MPGSLRDLRLWRTYVRGAGIPGRTLTYVCQPLRSLSKLNLIISVHRRGAAVLEWYERSSRFVRGTLGKLWRWLRVHEETVGEDPPWFGFRRAMVVDLLSSSRSLDLLTAQTSVNPAKSKHHSAEAKSVSAEHQSLQ